MAQINEARKSLGDALKIAQLHNVDRSWLINLLKKIGDMDNSRLDWRRALRAYEQIGNLDPTDEDAQLQIIDLNLRLGEDKGAWKALDLYLKYLVGKERGADILPMLEDLARQYPGRQAVHARLAEAYKAVGRKADAIAQYDALGEILLDAGDVKEAAKTIMRIINLEPPDLDGYRELLKNLEASAS